MLGTKKALGIDITDGRISLALLRWTDGGIELVKAASGPVPAGAMENGNIKDAAALAGAVKELKSEHGIRARRAALSLVANPTLIQILDMPAPVPANIGQFVRNEVKRYVALSGKEVSMDFCGIGSRPKTGSRRLFVAAADGQKVAETIKASGYSRIAVEAVEPAVVAYARAFYDKKIAGRFDSNVLMVILRGGTLALCVFRKQTIDFVRTKNIAKEKQTSGELCQWLAEQINAVIQFYDVEVLEAGGNWEITVVADDVVRLPDNAEVSLKAGVRCDDLHIRTGENACQDTSVEQDDTAGQSGASPVAIGLAMRILDAKQGDLKINLLPEETSEVKTIKRDTLVAANIVSAVLVLMILAVLGLIFVAERANATVAYKKRTQISRDTRTLFGEQDLLDRQIKQLTDRPDRLKSILSLHHDADWPGLLKDVKDATPETLRITSLATNSDFRMSLKGLALSYEAVRLFVNMLNRSEHIESASLVETERDNKERGLVRYVINCSLAQRSEK